jgi:hypothetical protein
MDLIYLGIAVLMAVMAFAFIEGCAKLVGRI